jgi:Eukaryotic aspartyl protease
MHSLMLFSAITFSAIFATAAPVDGHIQSTHSADSTAYYTARSMLNSFHRGQDKSALVHHVAKRHSANITRLDGAVPFWLDDGVPRIIATVGTPPQEVELLLDTGSGITWVMGPEFSEPKTFKPEHSSTWKPTDYLTYIPYADKQSCYVRESHDRVNIAGHILEGVSLGVAETNAWSEKYGLPLATNCLVEQGILGLDRSSDV